MGAQCSRPVLRLENVSKIYPTGEVLRNVTWEVKPGAVSYTHLTLPTNREV